MSLSIMANEGLRWTNITANLLQSQILLATILSITLFLLVYQSTKIPRCFNKASSFGSLPRNALKSSIGGREPP